MPKWESELWSLLSSGDGENCPLRCQCKKRQSGGWCIDLTRKPMVELVNLGISSEEIPKNTFDFLSTEWHCEFLAKIERLTQRWLNIGKVFCPPVPLNIITQADEHQRIDIRLVPLRTYSGAIWRLKDGWVIHIKEDDSSDRQRFTVCHEAFHILAHCRSEKPVFRGMGREIGNFNEMLADAFAVFLLMPEEWVRNKWAEVNDVDELARIFWVPVPAMYARLKLSNLIP